MNAVLCVTIVKQWNVKHASYWREAVYSCLKGPPIYHLPSFIPTLVTWGEGRGGATAPAGGQCSAGCERVVMVVRRGTEARRSWVPTQTHPERLGFLFLFKAAAELSDTVTQYSQRKAFERGIVSSTTTPLCCATPEEAGLLQFQLNRGPTLSTPAGACAGCWGGQAELLNGASHVSITWNIKQCLRGWLTCLFDFGGQRDFWLKSKMWKQWEKTWFIPEDVWGKLGHLSSVWPIFITIYLAVGFSSWLHNAVWQYQAMNKCCIASEVKESSTFGFCGLNWHFLAQKPNILWDHNMLYSERPETCIFFFCLISRYHTVDGIV